MTPEALVLSEGDLGVDLDDDENPVRVERASERQDDGQRNNLVNPRTETGSLLGVTSQFISGDRADDPIVRYATNMNQQQAMADQI